MLERPNPSYARSMAEDWKPDYKPWERREEAQSRDGGGSFWWGGWRGVGGRKLHPRIGSWFRTIEGGGRWGGDGARERSSRREGSREMGEGRRGRRDWSS